MTNVRTHGLGSRLELDRHFTELEDDAYGGEAVDDAGEGQDLEAARREVVWLRKEVYDLRERLTNIRAQTEDVPPNVEDPHPWLRFATTIALTFVLGRLVHRLRLGAPGAAAVPMITAQIDRRFW